MLHQEEPNREKLRKRTHEYWEEVSKQKFRDYKCYIHCLLAEELRYADNAQRLHGVVNRVHTLAITSTT